MGNFFNKKRIIFVSVIILMVIIAGLYNTYAINIGFDETTPQTYDLALNFELHGEELGTIKVNAGKTKIIELKITNNNSDAVQYGVTYKMISPTTIPSNFVISVCEDSPNNPSGVVAAGSSVIVAVKMINQTSSDVHVEFNVANGYKNGGDLILASGEEIVPGETQGGSSGGQENVTPYTDFTYWLGSENSSISTFELPDSGVDLVLTLDTPITLASDEILLYTYNGSSQILNIPGTYTINGTAYNTKILSSLDVYFEEEYNQEFLMWSGAQGAFYNNDNITNVNFNSNVEFVSAYYDSYGSSSVTENSAQYLFYNCGSLTTVPIIPSSVTSLNSAFDMCENLTGDIRIESSNVSSASRIFYGTSKTINVQVPSGSTTYNTINALNTTSKPSNVTLTQY